MTFAIAPLVPGGAMGSVNAQPAGNIVSYHVVVTGLVPGSTHTIHDHSGSCTNANGSAHLSVLATTVADSSGVVAFDTTVPAFEFGAGRIVIVYETGSPLRIIGCASL